MASVQARLNKLGYNAGAADGIFGKRTYNAVVAFQRANGLSVDGIVGKNTELSFSLLRRLHLGVEVALVEVRRQGQALHRLLAL